MRIVPVVYKDAARMVREKCMEIEESYMCIIEWFISYPHCHNLFSKTRIKQLKTLDNFIFITNNSTVTVVLQT